MKSFPHLDPSKKLDAAKARHLLSVALGYPVHRATFYRWLSNGTLPATKLVSKWLIEPRHLQRFAEEASL